MMKILLVSLLIFVLHTCTNESPQSSDLVGSWKIDIKLTNHPPRTMRFTAESGGKGTLLLEPKSNWDPQPKPTRAKWEIGSEKQVSITGPVEFPIGNVGREPGTLVFKGSFESDGSIKGDLKFFKVQPDAVDLNATPDKAGSFKAMRADSK